MAETILESDYAQVRPNWSAIFVGLAVGISTQFLLGLLGVAIGLTTLDVTGRDQNTQGVGIGAAVWTLVSAIISWFVGAYAAGYGARRRGTGLLHGIATWTLGLVAVVILVSSGVGGILSGAMRVAGSSADIVSQSNLVNRSEVEKYGTQAQDTLREKAQNLQPEDAQKVTKGAAAGAWGTFIAALLSFGAACIGGWTGARGFERRVIVRRQRVLAEERTTRVPPGGPTVFTPA